MGERKREGERRRGERERGKIKKKPKILVNDTIKQNCDMAMWPTAWKLLRVAWELEKRDERDELSIYFIKLYGIIC